MSQQRQIEPATWRLPALAAAFYWIREHGPVSAVFCSGSVGTAFLTFEEFTPGALTDAELIDRGCVPWQNNRFIPLTFERLGFLKNSLTAGSGTPHLLIYSRAIPWSVT